MKRSAIAALGILLSAQSWAAGAGHPMPSAIVPVPPAPPHAVAVPPAAQPVAPGAIEVPAPPPRAVAVPPAVQPAQPVAPR
jgi:hypothetical protein